VLILARAMTAVLQPVLSSELDPESLRWTSRIALQVRSHPRAAILVGFCTLSVLIFSSAWVSPFSNIIGNPDGDQVGYFWCLTWPIWAITHGHNPLLSTYLNYPAGFNVMWTYPPLLALLAAPVTALAGPVFSYNLLTTLGLAVSGWLMALATRRFVCNWTAAIVAGLLFGFGPFQLAQALDHVVLNAQFAPPLLLLLLHEAFVRQRWRSWQVGLCLATVITAQLLTFVEGLAILGVVFALALPVLWWIRDDGWRARLPFALRSLGVGAAAAAALCALPIATMFFGPQHIGSGALRPPGTFVSNLANVVVPSPTQLLAPNHDVAVWTVTNPAEWDAYLGVPLLLIAAVVMIRSWSQRFVRFFSVMALLAFILSLGPTLRLTVKVATPIHLPALFLGGLPFFENVLWSRVAVIVELFVAVLVAGFLATRRRGRWLLPSPFQGLAIAGLILAWLPLFPYPSGPAPQMPDFFKGSEVQRIPEGSVALIAPFTENGANDDPEYWQAVSNFRYRMIGGYVFVPGPRGPSNPPLTLLSAKMYAIQSGNQDGSLTNSTRSALLAELTQDDVRTVVVGPTPHRDVMVAFMTNLTGRPPQEDQGVEVWWNV
jgi:hypothetical protein